MSALLLDDIGLSLLRDLHEARESLDIHRWKEDCEFPITYMRELWARDAVQNALLESYIDHLIFIRGNPDYAPRLTYSLQHFGGMVNHDVMLLIDQLKYMDDISDRWWIADLSLEFYQWYAQRNP